MLRTGPYGSCGRMTIGQKENESMILREFRFGYFSDKERDFVNILDQVRTITTDEDNACLTNII